MRELLEYMGYVPYTGVWELTLACNMRCQHCGSHAGEPRADELGWDEMRRVAQELVALGTRRMTLSGGEPTMNPHWDRLGALLVERGVRVNMISNGWSWRQSHLDRARRAGLTSVGFSLDGFEDVHDRIRRPGSFARVEDAVRLNVGQGFPTAVISHVNQPNWRTLPELGEHLAGLGVSRWQLQLGNPAGEMCEHTDLVLAEDDILELVPMLARLREAMHGRMVVDMGDNIGYYGCHEAALRRDLDDPDDALPFWHGCAAGCQVIGIESNGNIKGCLSLPSAKHGKDLFVEGNLRDRPLAEIWCAPGAFAYNRAFSTDQLTGFCATCPYRELCRGGCSWTAHSHTGTRYDNPACFYRIAIRKGRHDLLGDPGEVLEQVETYRQALRELQEEDAEEGA